MYSASFKFTEGNSARKTFWTEKVKGVHTMCHYVQGSSQFCGKFEQINLKGLFQFQNKISAAVRQWNNKI
jgi:hypothetical protein